MYYIYHIPGVKIGCTTEPDKRVTAQGYSEYEILESYSDIHIASNREIELQKQYGYAIDKVPYYISKKNRKKYSKDEMIKGGTTNVKNGHLQSISSFASKDKIWINDGEKNKRIYPEYINEWINKGFVLGFLVNASLVKCPHCGKDVKRHGMKNYHFDNCKSKPK
jgi:hypothetical protein